MKKAGGRTSQRGKAHEDSVKAQVVAALLLGMGVMEAAREFNLPQTTVSTYKGQIPEEKFVELRSKKGEILDEMVFDYMRSNLRALRAQAEEASEPSYIQKQPAGELATLHGVMADKLCRLLEAVSRPASRQLPPGDA